MKLEQFTFTLPDELIALKPIFPQEEAKMLVVNSSQHFTDSKVGNLSNYFMPGDLIVFNDSKVIPSNLIGQNNGHKINFNLYYEQSLGCWQAFAKPAKKIQISDIITFGENFTAQVIDKHEGSITLDFEDKINFWKNIEEWGQVPLPLYILKKRKADKEDSNTYQTIYAKHKGSTAAPTAGLHFSKELMAELKDKGVEFAFVTLHTGAGTFLPIKTENINDHKMHVEHFFITEENARIINKAKSENRRIIAVGTTSMRVLETVAAKYGEIKPVHETTNLYVTPGYDFKIVDRLFTNFHLPGSTLFVLVCSFMGFDKMHKVYSHAIENNYRFYSYGDCCLLDRIN